ncbi:phosphatidylinositol-specific phospholipase C [Bacillus thuringiensis]|uniref:phosphatidylinositol-specific phospholipase C n=1 Tax=Bacillus thuringiensis TaxID=1428 RepID=UPI003BF69C0E
MDILNTNTTSETLNVEADACLMFKRYKAAAGKLQNLKKWMTYLPDKTPLIKISLPGTHDAGTFTMSDWNPLSGLWKTQHLDFRKQMDKGARFFDIRGVENCSRNSIDIYHWAWRVDVDLSAFISDAKDFLKAHPDETIIMSLKRENPYSVDPDIFMDIFKNVYYDASESIFLKTGGNITLGEARGKIVLFRRFEGESILGGYNVFDWPDNSSFTTRISVPGQDLEVSVQDVYKSISRDVKSDKIIELLQNANNNFTENRHLYLNFTSLSSYSGAIPLYWWDSSTPYGNAQKINPKIANFIREHDLKRTGWVIMDYLGWDWSPDLAYEIIMTNVNLLINDSACS